MKVYIVISIDNGNLPCGVYDTFEQAKDRVEDMATRKMHGCVCEYEVNKNVVEDGSIKNIYDNMCGASIF